jgi:sterol desaturase/sphingolipid hydroxylase (fatty acid hydroxylase superfamily)
MNTTEVVAQLDKLDAVLRPGLFVLVVFLILLELAVLSIKKVSINHRGGGVSILSGAFVFGLEAVADFLFYLSITYWLYAHRILDMGFKWYVWVFCFLLYDLMFYVSHLLQHKVRLLWCFHSVHHTAEEMRLSTAVRGSMFDFIYAPPFFVWMCVPGIHPLMFIVVRTVPRVWGVPEHISEPLAGNMPGLNRIFITPDVHRVHHGKNAQYIDKNYAGVLSIWDRLFGTYVEYNEQPVYGILKPVDANNFFDIQFAEFNALYADVRATRGWANKLKLTLKPPGIIV